MLSQNTDVGKKPMLAVENEKILFDLYCEQLYFLIKSKSKRDLIKELMTRCLEFYQVEYGQYPVLADLAKESKSVESVEDVFSKDALIKDALEISYRLKGINENNVGPDRSKCLVLVAKLLYGELRIKLKDIAKVAGVKSDFLTMIYNKSKNKFTPIENILYEKLRNTIMEKWSIHLNLD